MHVIVYANPLLSSLLVYVSPRMTRDLRKKNVVIHVHARILPKKGVCHNKVS